MSQVYSEGRFRRGWAKDFSGLGGPILSESLPYVDWSTQPLLPVLACIAPGLLSPGRQFVQNLVFKRLLETERAATEGENWKHTALDNQNYNFTAVPDDGADKLCPYALAVEPKVPPSFSTEVGSG
jgi:hypothetical protein